MRSGEEIVLEYCDKVETHDIEHLQSSHDNAREIRNGNYLKWELSGCPSSFGLSEEEWQGLCYEEEVKGYKAQCEQCKNCWIKALEENFDR